MATRRITVLEADETILFSDLPALIAEALHDDEVMQAMSRIELEAELSHMVDAGSLTVRNPFTLGPLAFKHGDVLANSVVTLDDMRPLLEAKGIKLHVERTWETFNRTLGNDFFPDGTCSYSQAAHEIAQAQGWNGDRESALNAEMASAINAGQLPTYDRHTGLRLPADGRREFMGLVTVDDVNGWLESRGALYRWVRPSDSTGVVTLLPPISRVLVDDAVTLVVNAMPYPFEVGQDGLTAIERAVDGMNGKKFLRACKSLDILPRNPHDPFAEYAGEEEQAVLFEITVDEFTRYAAAHGVVARVADLEQAAQAGDDSEVSDVPNEAEPCKTGAVTMWTLNKPERLDTLAYLIYNVLKSAHTAGRAKPKARDVMADIEAARPSDFIGIAEGDLKYLDSNGDAKTANLEAIRKRIDRLTGKKVDVKQTLAGRQHR